MAELLLIDGVKLEKGIRLPDVKAYAGDVVWVETENALYTDIFVGLLLGLIHPKKGRFKFITSDVSYCDVSEWTPGLKKALSLCKAYSYSLSNFKRLLSGANADYVLDMDVKDMAKSTKVLVSWAISLSTPSLNIILNDPFYGLDKKASAFLSTEIEGVAKDGSLVIILSPDRPAVFSQQVRFTMGGKK